MRLKRKAHKGQNGRVLVVGGSEDYVGAPYLAAMAALRSGVDLVTVCAPEKVAWTINSYSPDLITRKFFGKEFDLSHCKEIIKLSEANDVVLIGPGLGIKKDFVLKLVRNIKKPMVIDADALKVINIDYVENTIFTPHEKEFEILCKNSFPDGKIEDKKKNIERIKKQLHNNIILLKGPQDKIIGLEKEHINKTGNAAMSVGGTGDVLAGLCAGIYAQSKDAFESAKEAAYANGKTGETLFKSRGYAFAASDMLSELWRFVRIY